MPTKLAFLALCLATSSISHANLISGFEHGLAGWDYIGDVSIQSSDLGARPTQGRYQAVLTTLCDGVIDVWCETIGREMPLSGVNGVPANRRSDAPISATQFLGLPTHPHELAALLPGPYRGETGAIRREFFAHQGDTLSFDWNFMTMESGSGLNDRAYLTIWSEDTSFRYFGFLIPPDMPSLFGDSDVDLCAHVIYGRSCDEIQPPSIVQTRETGYRSTSFTLPFEGLFNIGFFIGEGAEGAVPSALALDNFRLAVDEPETNSLLMAALAALLLSRRRMLTRKARRLIGAVGRVEAGGSSAS
jgi:hypothetical protein